MMDPNTQAHTVLSWLFISILILCIFIATPIQADILIGQTSSTGASSSVAAGMAFAFDEVNALGGVHSQNLSLIVFDDAANATRSLENVKQLVDDYDVLLLTGAISTPAFSKVLPFIAERHVPFVGPVTGVSLTRKPFVEEVVNVRASYSDEITYHLAFLTKYVWVNRVGILYQDDEFGQAGYSLAVAGLQYVGLSLVAAAAYTPRQVDVETAVNTLVSATPKLQAVILVSAQAAAVKFIQLYKQDSRSDPACIFTVMSVGSSNTFTAQLTQKYWKNVYIFLAVPVPGDPRYAIAKHFDTAYQQAGFIPDTLAFEGYVMGRLIIQVLKNLPNSNSITRQKLLDEIYNTHLFVLDGLHLGLYSRNYDGCSEVLCACNSGLRSVFLTTPNATTGQFVPGFPVMTYPITQCSNTLSVLNPPLLFGQLIPRDDPVWTALALQIGLGISAAFADANDDGGLSGRQFVLVQREYSDRNVIANIMTRTAQIARVSTKSYAVALPYAIKQLKEDHSLLGFVGSVVNESEYAEFPLPTVGTFDTMWDLDDHEFYASDMRIQPNTAMEVMALAQYAAQQPHRPVHLRAPDTEKGRHILANMLKAVYSTQRRPTSAKTYSDAEDALHGVKEGWILGFGEDGVMQSWFLALQGLPDVDLLTNSASALRLLASLSYASPQQTSQVHFPSFNAGVWDTTVQGEAAAEAYRYGYLAGHSIVQVMQHSEFSHLSYSTAEQLQDAWYNARLITYKAISLGSYLNENCSRVGDAECECNEGLRRLAIRNGASAKVEYIYTSLTCHVTYQPLQDGAAIAGAIGGSVGGLSLIIGIMFVFIVFSRRSHRAAPKDEKQPFCIIFTDIQSSTNLWATIPKEMAIALNVHHTIIRKLLKKYNCYEVKTIGDSFMCACHTPAQAINFALALQQKFYEYEWCTKAIDDVYNRQRSGNDQGECWNGLRVRVGIHHGLGEIHVDPVSKGYDYYGTVVNTASRIEAVCHGGQIGVSAAVYAHLGAEFPDVVWTDLGVHSLRGLSEPIKLYQALPAGPLASRQFPPLRIDYELTRDLDARLDVDDECSMMSGSSKKNSVVPLGSTKSNIEHWHWTEVHPLVINGEVTADDLKSHYNILFTAFATLLSTQTQKFKELVIDGFCNRLHIHNYGTQGVGLQRTIRGLVHRVLPATVASVDLSHANRSKHFSPTKSGLHSFSSTLKKGDTAGPEETVEPWP